MKKTLIIALAGMMLFAFTQCGGGKSTQQFKDTKELLTKIENAVKEAETCDDLQEAALAMLFGSLSTDDYDDDQKMTDSEKAEIDKLGEKIKKAMESKIEKLGCEDD